MSDSIYRILFHNRDEVYELYCHSVGDSGIFGFVEIAELVFGERSELLVDPGEERLKSEFEGVERFYIPQQAVIRIDQVNRLRSAKVHGGSVSHFPLAGQGRKPDNQG